MGSRLGWTLENRLAEDEAGWLSYRVEYGIMSYDGENTGMNLLFAGNSSDGDVRWTSKRQANLRGFFSAARFDDSDWDLLDGWNLHKSDTASSNFNGRRLRFLLLVSVSSSLTILL